MSCVSSSVLKEFIKTKNIARVNERQINFHIAISRIKI